MIHFGKKPSGDLEIIVTADEVGEVYDAIDSAGLLQRRTFDRLKSYVKAEFAAELEDYRNRMAARMVQGKA